ncbi:hypothetical protein AXI59_07190 [Bacillus nakamurai]|uniref:aspartyl-phosphate phosphatase Spo0E family protein n=1 Tax=Bacillus nakamurai TaxID=1793963 RepID=UPI0007786F49|nr:aspartyl-phosphate phosphatase Spo0E family protein [Bacillus nakamurai]KXZ24089.1 hypothetical protein AXI59_07190 [Bacillus nakamurai]MCP6683511.1 aspartyl-phosphate phosphatase Spo0E family protein [Bacillus nakamurai]
MNRKIEEMRLTLFETAQKFGINATETIRCSQELDILLNGCRAELIQCEQAKDTGESGGSDRLIQL